MPQQTMNLMRECIPIFTVLSDENRHQILRVFPVNAWKPRDVSLLSLNFIVFFSSLSQN